MKAVELTAEVAKPPYCLYDECCAWFRPSQVGNSSTVIDDGSDLWSCDAMYGRNGVESTASSMLYW